jgi:hypothetical protein
MLLELVGSTSLITRGKHQRKPLLINTTGPSSLPCRQWSGRGGSVFFMRIHYVQPTDVFKFVWEVPWSASLASRKLGLKGILLVGHRGSGEQIVVTVDPIMGHGKMIISKFPRNNLARSESLPCLGPESVAPPREAPWERNCFLDLGTRGPKNR